jgi:hypothetical protein
MSPRVNLPTTRSLDDLTVGELRRLLHAGIDESLTVVDALAALHESDQATAAHELDVRQYNAYVDRRDARHAAALAEAATAADKANRTTGDGARMAARQAARLEADETFERRQPLLSFTEWQSAGKPDVLEVEAGVLRRAVQSFTELVQ